MGVLEEQIEKARGRAKGLDLRSLADASKDRTPAELASPEACRDRRRMLAETLGDRQQGDIAYERLIGGDELQPVNYLPHGIVAARPVCRLTLTRPSGYATGFLVAPGVLLTNHHVFPSAGSAEGAVAEFELELDVFDRPKAPVAFELVPAQLYLTSQDLDFSIVAVTPLSRTGVPLTKYGFLPLIAEPGKALEGEWLTIVQHPSGKPKQICIRENKLLTRTDQVLWYATDTLAGSSGSPVFNNGWQVVALHHKGIPETKDGVWQTRDGRNYDPGRDDETDLKWIANEGIRISTLVQELRKQAPQERLLDAVFSMTPSRAQALIDGFAQDALAPELTPPRVAMPMESGPPRAAHANPSPPMPRSITVTLDVLDDGRVTVRPPDGEAIASLERTPTPPAGPADRPADYDIPFDDDYSRGGDRQGYQQDFLGDDVIVALPELGPLEGEATRLLKPERGQDPHVLNYRGYSLVMHATRKFAIYTAANVDGGNRYRLRRQADEWRFDPRIPRAAQIGAFYYAHNQFDRGHLTRYEDMEFGEDVQEAIQSATDTLHWTNCTPQHAKFNQGKQLWQGLEQHFLEQSIRSDVFRACVFTGPVLDEGDPVWERYKEIQYPLKFWKIGVARTSEDKLFAAGFVLDQSDVIDQFGIEATVEVPFSAFKTYQVPIAEVERLTGLSFRTGGANPGKLSSADPLAADSPRRRTAARRAIRATEATGALDARPGYIPIEDEQDIVGA